MAQANTKPKPAAPAAAKGKPATAAKGGKATTKPAAKPAAKAAPAAAKPPAAPKVIFEEGTFLKFNGYRSEVDKSEALFKEGAILYVVEVENDPETGILYNCILAEDIADYNEDADSVTGGQVAPAEVSEIKGSALEKARDQFMPITMIGKLAELMEANDNPIEVAIELNQSIQETYFWLGGALATILQTGAYLKENGGDFSGEEAFNDFCQAEFNFKASKGRQLARLYQTFSVIPNFEASRLDAVGWSKAAIAERFVTEENVEEILDIAESTGQRELAVKLKEKYASDGKTASGKAASRGTTSSIQKKSITFKLEEDAAETVELVLQACMKQTGIEDPNLALERIAVEWAQDHIEADTTKTRISNKAAKVAKARAAAAKPPAEAKAPAKAPAKPAAPAAAPPRARKK